MGLPQEKITHALGMLELFLNRKKAKVREFMRLAGTLNFLTRALCFGNPFLRRIYETIRGMEWHLGWRARVGYELKQDLLMWKEFLLSEPFYKRFVDTGHLSSEEVQWFTDASGSPDLGYGCYLGGTWFQQRWPPGFIATGKTSTCLLELIAVVASILKWANKFPNKKVLLHCDNQATVQILNKLTLKCKYCMEIVRVIVGTCMVHNFRVEALYVNTLDNGIADSLSRFQQERFFQLVRGVQLRQVSPPPFLHKMLMRLHMRMQSKA